MKGRQKCKRERSLSEEAAVVAFMIERGSGNRMTFDCICTCCPVHLLCLFRTRKKKKSILDTLCVGTRFHYAPVFLCPKAAPSCVNEAAHSDNVYKHRVVVRRRLYLYLTQISNISSSVCLFTVAGQRHALQLAHCHHVSFIYSAGLFFFFQSHWLFLEQVKTLTLHNRANNCPKLERQRRHLARLSAICMSFFLFFFSKEFSLRDHGIQFWEPFSLLVNRSRALLSRFYLFHCSLLAHGSECYFIWWKLPVIASPRRCSVPVQAQQHSTVCQSISASGGKLYNPHSCT